LIKTQIITNHKNKLLLIQSPKAFPLGKAQENIWKQ